MALSELESQIGRLGTQLAQQHFAFTSDLDGVLPWLPTDADRQELVRMLGRSATLYEEHLFEAGYRESMMRLDGNAHDTRMNPIMRAELYGLLARYGVGLPPEGTPERAEVEILIGRALAVIRDRIAQLLPPPPPPPSEPGGGPDAEPSPEAPQPA